MVWRDASVQHFDTPSGDYIWPPRSSDCVPFREVTLDDYNRLQTWNPALQVTHHVGCKSQSTVERDLNTGTLNCQTCMLYYYNDMTSGKSGIGWQRF